GLSAHRPALDDDGLEPFRGAIDRRAEPGWPGTVDREIVLRARRVAEPAQLFGNLANSRMFQPRAIGETADGQTGIAEIVYPGDASRILVGPQLYPAEGHIAAVQKVADRVSGGRAAGADKLDRLVDILHFMPSMRGVERSFCCLPFTRLSRHRLNHQAEGASADVDGRAVGDAAF